MGCAGRVGQKGGKWVEATTGLGHVLKRNGEEKEKGKLGRFREEMRIRPKAGFGFRKTF
jgi:hypothetical protein